MSADLIRTGAFDGWHCGLASTDLFRLILLTQLIVLVANGLQRL